MRGARRLAPLLVTAMLVTAMLGIARSAEAGDEAAASEALFSEGKRLVQEGNYAAACPKFDESHKLDPGLGTLYRLADCYEHVGRTASAWAAFVEVASSAKTQGQQARADDAKKRADALEPNLARLRIRVAEPDLPGLAIKRGDVVVGRAQWNSVMPVDPGEIAVEATAPDHAPWRGTVRVEPRGSGEIAVPALARAAARTADASSGGASGSTEGATLGGQRTLAVAAGGAAVVALGIGSVFGLVSMSRRDDADTHCDASNVCDDDGLALRRDARSAGDVSTVAFIAGGVLAATGITLWLTAPSRPSSARAGVTPRWGGVTFHMELP